jgi:hypothetical protein
MKKACVELITHHFSWLIKFWVVLKLFVLFMCTSNPTKGLLAKSGNSKFYRIFGFPEVDKWVLITWDFLYCKIKNTVGLLLWAINSSFTQYQVYYTQPLTCSLKSHQSWKHFSEMSVEWCLQMYIYIYVLWMRNYKIEYTKRQLQLDFV